MSVYFAFGTICAAVSWIAVVKIELGRFLMLVDQLKSKNQIGLKLL